MTKVYVVRYGEYSDQGIVGVFSTKEKAEKYCDVQNETLDLFNDYWVDEFTLDDCEIPLDAQVVKYFAVCISTEDDCNCGAGEIYYADEEKRVLTAPVIIDKCDGWISVLSTKSMEHARKVAIEQYQIYTQQKLENGEV